MTSVEQADLFFSRKMFITRKPYYNFVTGEILGTSIEDIPEQLKLILDLVRKDTGCMPLVAEFKDRDFTVLDEEGYGVSMYFFTGDIHLARVAFKNKRCGSMTELYSYLKSIQSEYKTGKIRIDCVISSEMRSWCKKHNFTEYGTTASFEES